MEYLITESQYKLLVEVVRISPPNEDIKIVYKYDNIYASPSKTNPNEISRVYFNGVKGVKSQYTEPYSDEGIIEFTGPDGDFKFPMKSVNKDKENYPYNPFVWWSKLFSQESKFKPFLNKKFNASDKPDTFTKQKINKPKTSDTPETSNKFTSEEITKALEMTFSGNTTGKGGIWVPETKNFSAGVRGIYTVGDKLNSDESWSIMNWFNSKKEVIELIDDKWLKEGSGDKVEWLSSVFQNDKNFLDKLLIKQWSSIKDGLKREDAALNNLIKMLEGKKFTYELYPPGHKTDRYDSIDISITIENGKPITFQVKPLNSVPTLKDGETKITTYGMSNFYKNKNKLNYIMYNNGNDYILFKNKDYRVFNDGREVIHSGEPLTTIF